MMKLFKNRFPNLSTLFLVLGFALIASSCGSASVATPLKNAKINSVDSKTKLLSLIEASREEDIWFVPSTGVSTEESVELPPGDNNGEGDVRDYVDTNVQVEGVAEGDIVKTDGYQIYYAPRYQNRVHIFAVDNEGGISYDAQIDLANTHVDSLYLLDKYLVVVGYTFATAPSCDIYEGSEGDDYICYSWMWWSPTGTVVVYDRETLDVVYSLETDTNFLDHRMIDDSLFLVGHKYLYQSYEVDELRPTYTVGAEKTYLGYDQIYYFDDTSINGMSVLTGIKLTDNPNQIAFSSKAYLGAGYSYKQIYVSLTDLYISDTVSINTNTSYYQTMTISQFSLDVEEATFDFVAAGIVEGGMLNQFSMDYFNGYLRVATTDQGATWKRLSSDTWEWTDYERFVNNHLYVLKLNNKKDGFNIISHISEGLGKPLESIRSVRFLGNRAYIVTFLQTDPLYIIDLIDPAKPVITDEIHLPGFDTYQHPWGENYLLGIGYDADPNGRINGMKLTAYNTTSGGALEMQTLKLNVDYGDELTTVWTYSYSEALWNHKSLLVSTEHNIIGFPVNAYEYGYTHSPDEPLPSSGYDNWFFRYHSYYYLFKIDFSKTNPIPEPIKIEHPMSESYYVGVDRAVMIDDFVYTLSDHQVVTYDLVNNAIVEQVLEIPTNV